MTVSQLLTVQCSRCKTWVPAIYGGLCVGCCGARLDRREKIKRQLSLLTRGQFALLEAAIVEAGRRGSQPSRGAGTYGGIRTKGLAASACDFCGRESDDVCTVIGPSAQRGCYRCRMARGEKPNAVDRWRAQQSAVI